MDTDFTTMRKNAVAATLTQLLEGVQRGTCGELYQRRHLGRTGSLRFTNAPLRPAGGPSRAGCGYRVYLPWPGAGLHTLRCPPRRFHGTP